MTEENVRVTEHVKQLVYIKDPMDELLVEMRE